MEKIASFQVDHLRLLRGIYVSRVDQVSGNPVTTFDWRWKEPNREPVLDVPASHTLEHMGATFLRSHPIWKDRTVYFGPMGCRTGFYLILAGQISSADVVPLLRDMISWILTYQGEVPGASAAECGNWRDHNLDMAQWEARRFQEQVLDRIGPANLSYPS